eukprot:4769243-Prymnesium_polylepis.1
MPPAQRLAAGGRLAAGDAAFEAKDLGANCDDLTTNVEANGAPKMLDWPKFSASPQACDPDDFNRPLNQQMGDDFEDAVVEVKRLPLCFEMYSGKITINAVHGNKM